MEPVQVGRRYCERNGSSHQGHGMASLRCAAQLVTDVPSTSGRHAVTTKPSNSSSSRQPHHHQPQLHQCPVLPIQLQPRALSAPRQQPPAQQQSPAAKIGQGAPGGSLQLQAPPVRRLFTLPGPGMPVTTPNLTPPGSRTSTPATSAPSQEGSSGSAYPQHSVAPHTSQPSDQSADLQLETPGQQLQRRRKPQRRRFRLTVSRTSSADLFAEPSPTTDHSPSPDVLPGSSSQIGAAHTRSRAAAEGFGARRQQDNLSANSGDVSGQSPTVAGAGAGIMGNAQGSAAEADAVSKATVPAVYRLYVQQPEQASSALRGGAFRLLLSEDGGGSWRSQSLRPRRPCSGAGGSSSGGGKLLMAEVALQPQQDSTRSQESAGSAVAPPPGLQVFISEGPGHGPPPAGALLGNQLQQHLP